MRVSEDENHSGVGPTRTCVDPAPMQTLGQALERGHGSKAPGTWASLDRLWAFEGPRLLISTSIHNTAQHLEPKEGRGLASSKAHSLHPQEPLASAVLSVWPLYTVTPTGKTRTWGPEGAKLS